MDDTDDAAASAAGKAYAHIVSARSNLIGRRLPLAGVHRDVGAALDHLRSAQREISAAIHLIEEHQAGEPRSTTLARRAACPDCGLMLSTSQDGDGQKVTYDLVQWQRRCKRQDLASPVLCLASRQDHGPDTLN